MVKGLTEKERSTLERIAGVIRSVSPDLVSLQEVDRKVIRSKSVDQPAELARLCDMRVVFEKKHRASRRRIWECDLEQTPDFEPSQSSASDEQPGRSSRCAGSRTKWERTCPTPFVSRKPFRPSPRSGDRIASAYAINELVTGMERPIVLAGDLNAPEDAEPLKVLLADWTNTATKSMPTIPVKKPTRQIDFILCKASGMRFKTVEIRVLDEEIASDHRPIFAVIDFNELIPICRF